MVSPPLSPCPPQAGSWCSRLERRPYVRLIVLGNEPRHANGLGPRIPKLPSEFDLCTNESHPLTRSSPCEGLLFSQGVSGYEPLRRDRRQRLEDLTTGDGRTLPTHLKIQISRELDRLELLLDQIKRAEAERDALLAAQQAATPASPGKMLLEFRGIGAE